MAGVMCSDCLMILLCHHVNWKASEPNLTDFPQVRHYNGLNIHYVNEIYEYIFGFPKYVNWDISTK